MNDTIPILSAVLGAGALGCVLLVVPGLALLLLEMIALTACSTMAVLARRELLASREELGTLHR